MHAPIERAELVAAERRVVAGRGRLTVQTGTRLPRRAVIAGEDDQRVIVQAQVAQRAQDLPDSIVHRSDHGRIRAPFGRQRGKPLHIPFRRMHGIVRRIERHVGKERAGTMIADELRRLAREHFRRVLSVLEDFAAIAPQVVIVRDARLAPVVAMRVVIDAARMESEEAVEAVRIRIGLGGVTQMPFAEKTGGVARGL
jgi:hypothetical protein